MSACGILPRVAQQTTAAAVSPITTTARAVSKSLEATSHNMAVASAAAERASRQASMTAAQARAAARTAARQRHQAERLAERTASIRKQAQTSARAQETFDILPAAILVQLTEGQAALQRAAQKEALTAPIGEEIYWEDSGRTGTAMAEDEKPMGGFICRTFVQSVRLDLAEERGRAIACRNPDGVWEAALSRTELAP
ncbi:MAG: hypothetical protein AB7E79_11740 [Rhodospirillaceae bacterium]